MNNTIKQLIDTINVVAEHNNETAARLRARREAHEREHCFECGRRITEWDSTEQTDDELIFTYFCPCGCIAEQHYQLTYTGTDVLREADVYAE